jgi:hypothetical protein
VPESLAAAVAVWAALTVAITPWCSCQVPWANLGKAPVIVEMDRLYVLACPKTEYKPPPPTAAVRNRVRLGRGNGRLLAPAYATGQRRHRLTMMKAVSIKFLHAARMTIRSAPQLRAPSVP